MKSIRTKLVAASLSATAIGLSPMLYLAPLSLGVKILCVLGALGLCAIVVYKATESMSQNIQALEVGLLNFKDGEYAATLACSTTDEFAHLCALYNASAQSLRKEKQWLHQRELMLDKVLQSSPDVLLLVNDKNDVVFSNHRARDFFAVNQRLEGLSLPRLLSKQPHALSEVMLDSREGLFTLPQDEKGVETWHLAQGTFLLNNQQHTLYILKQMTRELNRQEVSVWKKVIRVISHELNNSLGPISSLLHSGKIVANQNQDPRLERVFLTIEERIAHLNQFVQGYGKFAKLPTPVFAPIEWASVIAQLKQQYEFTLDMPTPVNLHADAVQIEQLLINLLKNAHEAGGSPRDIHLVIKQQNSHVVLEVLDAGKGMSEQVMTNALVPFYSTKANGSGLGLALCREICDAHGGHLVIQNRQQKGLCVRVIFDGDAGR